MVEIKSAPPPAFVRVTAFDTLVVPTAWSPNERLIADREITGVGVGVGAAVAVLVAVRVAVLVALAVAVRVAVAVTAPVLVAVAVGVRVLVSLPQRIAVDLCEGGSRSSGPLPSTFREV
jgi:hypothetical protein